MFARRNQMTQSKTAGERALEADGELEMVQRAALSEAEDDAEEADNLAGHDEENARALKLKALRKRLQESSNANRKEVAQEANRRRLGAAEDARLERKRKQAEVFVEKLEAAESGTDLERQKAWAYSVEDNEAWDKKLAKKARRAQHEFTDYDDVARRKYKKDLDTFKPDMKSYNLQRDAASGHSLTAAEGDLQALPTASSSQVALANEMLYRDANSFIYADHKPSEEAVDRVVAKINMDVHKRNTFSRKRKEGNADVTYINEKNKAFNKKLDRFFNKYTQETRDNFERGTAL